MFFFKEELLPWLGFVKKCLLNIWTVAPSGSCSGSCVQHDLSPTLCHSRNLLFLQKSEEGWKMSPHPGSAWKSDLFVSLFLEATRVIFAMWCDSVQAVKSRRHSWAPLKDWLVLWNDCVSFSMWLCAPVCIQLLGAEEKTQHCILWSDLFTFSVDSFYFRGANCFWHWLQDSIQFKLDNALLVFISIFPSSSVASSPQRGKFISVRRSLISGFVYNKHIAVAFRLEGSAIPWCISVEGGLF